jgi:hypothetical protein
MDNRLTRGVNSVTRRATRPLSNYDSIMLNHHASSNESDDQPGPLAPSISTTQSANTVRTYHSDITRGRARAQYGDAHYHGGTHLHLHCKLSATCSQSKELTSAVPSNSNNGYSPAAAHQDYHRNSNTLVIYNAQQAVASDSNPRIKRDMPRLPYLIPVGNQQSVYDYPWDERTVH